MTLKSYQVLILVLLGSLFLASLCGGVAKLGLDPVVQRFPYLAKHLDYNHDAQTYNIAKPYRYLAMGTALILLIGLGRRLQILPLARVGLQPRQGSWRQLCWGTAIGLISLTVVVVILFICGARTPRADLELFHAVGEMVVFIPQAALIGLVEETFFRGFILQSFLRDMKAVTAILVTSVAFSALHFLDAQVIRPVGFDPLAGFYGLAIFKGLLAHPIQMLPELIGLALVGIVLSCAYVWTRSLYLGIGLHAGWVFTLSASRLLLKRDHYAAQWFFGNGLVVTGLLGIVGLLGVLLLLYVVWGRANRSPERLPDSR